MCEYNLGTFLSFKENHGQLHILLDRHYTSLHGLSEEEHAHCTVVKEMIGCLHNSNTVVLCKDECSELIEFLCTMWPFLYSI